MIATGAHAVTIATPLEDLVGDYEEPGDSQVGSFSFGVGFSRIDLMWVEVTVGDADPGGMCIQVEPPECTVGTILVVTLTDVLGESSLATAFTTLRRDSRGATKFLGAYPEFILTGTGFARMELVGLEGPLVLPGALGLLGVGILGLVALQRQSA
jgi:hypothetical protein